MAEIELLDENEFMEFINEQIPKTIKESSNQIEPLDLQYYINAFTTAETLLSADASLEQIKASFGLIQNFHTALTGEKLHYLITLQEKNVKEAYVSWEELMPFLKLEDEALHFKMRQLINVSSKQNAENKISSVAAWEKFKPFFENIRKVTYDENSDHAIKDGYTSSSGHKHDLYLHRGRDSRMRLYYSPYTYISKNSSSEKEARKTNYTYEIRKGIFVPSFSAGNVKEWFDKKYLNNDENWFNKVMAARYPMAYILDKLDTDLGSLAGDFRLKQQKEVIIQDKLNNDKVVTIQQVKEQCEKIKSMLKAFSDKSTQKNAEQLIKIFLESDVSPKIAKEIISEAKLRLNI